MEKEEQKQKLHTLRKVKQYQLIAYLQDTGL